MSSSIEENKALIRRFFNAIESGNLQVLDEIVAEDYDDHLAGQTFRTRDRQEVLRRTSLCVFRSVAADFGELWLRVTASLSSIPFEVRTRAISLASRPLAEASTRWLFNSTRIENGQLAEHWEVADYALLIAAASRLIAC